jgi:hypothetical protein
MKHEVRIALSDVNQYFAGQNLNFLSQGPGQQRQYKNDINIAHCLLFVLLEFSLGFYGWDLTHGFPRLTEFYQRFKQRASIQGRGEYPADQRAKACRRLVWARGGNKDVNQVLEFSEEPVSGPGVDIWGL